MEAPQEKSIPAGAKVYVDLGQHTAGFAAALKAQQVPLEVVAEQHKADFKMEISKTVEMTVSDIRTNWEMTNVKIGALAFKCEVSRAALGRDSQRVTESCAKKLKKRIPVKN